MKYQNIAACWKKKDKNGKTFLSVKAERDIKAGESFTMFANDKQGNEARPDFRAYEKIEEEEAPAQKSRYSEEAEQVADDIPF
jgi:uncharacterized protein (DUF736 family)